MKINLPKKFQIAGHTVKVYLVDKLSDSCHGKWDSLSMEIFVAKNVDGKKQTTTQIKQSYWHEKVHCVLDIMSESVSENEKFVDLMGHFLQQIESSEKF